MSKGKKPKSARTGRPRPIPPLARAKSSSTGDSPMIAIPERPASSGHDEWARTLAYQEISHLAVRLQCLDREQRDIPGATATGFVIQDASGGQCLVTCWHVVTGLNPHAIKFPIEPAQRRFLKVTFRDEVPNGGITSVTGFKSIVVPLYENDKPPFIQRWAQNDAHIRHELLNENGLFVPTYHDIAMLPLEGSPVHWVHVVSKKWYSNGLLGVQRPGHRCLIVGFPFGFGSHGRALTSVVLVRSIASLTVPARHNEFLLDGIAAPGMSGAPIFIEGHNGLELFGAYTGVIFPDAAAQPDRTQRRLPGEDPSRVTDLGTGVDMMEILVGMQKVVFGRPPKEIPHPPE
jgi:hypothetical protein